MKKTNSPYLNKSTTQNFQELSKQKGKEYPIDKNGGNIYETAVVFNMRDVIEPIMLMEIDSCKTSFTPYNSNSALLNFEVNTKGSMEKYNDLLGINAITGKPEEDYAIPYNNVFVETENNDVTYCSLHILTFADNFVVFVRSMTKDFLFYGNVDEHNKFSLDYQMLKMYSHEQIAFVMSRFFAVMQVFRRMNDTSKKDLTCYLSSDETAKPVYVREKKEVKKLLPKPTYIILNKKDEHAARKYSNTTRGEITYSFSWLVRGHYRTLQYQNHYGKDRFGNYTMKGKTWIEPYTKGDKSLPLKKSEKIVVEQ